MDPRLANMIELLREDGFGYFYMSAEEVPLLERLTESRECGGVWKAIDKRLEIASSLHRDVLIDTFGERFERASELAETSFQAEVGRLVGAVADALRVVPFHEGAKTGERKQFARESVKTVHRLKQLLARLGEDDDFGCSQLYHQLSEHADRAANQVLEALMQPPEIAEYKAAAESPVAAEIALLAARSVASQPDLFLDAILGGIVAWAEAEPLIPRPGDPNADRLRMIRVVTEHFRRRYGSPLRAQVLAVVSAFFDASNLSESDIAKLAP